MEPSLIFTKIKILVCLWPTRTEGEMFRPLKNLHAHFSTERTYLLFIIFSASRWFSVAMWVKSFFLDVSSEVAEHDHVIEPLYTRVVLNVEVLRLVDKIGDALLQFLGQLLELRQFLYSLRLLRLHKYSECITYSIKSMLFHYSKQID